ncbi:MAG: CcmD family protein [Polyangiales bacterium]
MKVGGMFLAAALALAPMAASAQQSPAPGDERSMGFRPGLGDAARERVPGGRLLVGAYTAALVLIGGYVASVARRAAKLEDDLRRLEDDLARRAPKGEG